MSSPAAPRSCLKEVSPLSITPWGLTSEAPPPKRVKFQFSEDDLNNLEQKTDRMRVAMIHQEALVDALTEQLQQSNLEIGDLKTKLSIARQESKDLKAAVKAMELNRNIQHMKGIELKRENKQLRSQLTLHSALLKNSDRQNPRPSAALLLSAAESLDQE